VARFDGRQGVPWSAAEHGGHEAGRPRRGRPLQRGVPVPANPPSSTHAGCRGGAIWARSAIEMAGKTLVNDRIFHVMFSSPATTPRAACRGRRVISAVGPGSDLGASRRRGAVWAKRTEAQLPDSAVRFLGRPIPATVWAKRTEAQLPDSAVRFLRRPIPATVWAKRTEAQLPDSAVRFLGRPIPATGKRVRQDRRTSTLSRSWRSGGCATVAKKPATRNLEDPNPK